MTLDDPAVEDSTIIIEVVNPETPFGGVQVFGAVDPPILIDFGGTPGAPDIPDTPPEPSGSGVTDQGIVQLVNGQNYIDVLFSEAQDNANWLLVESVVVNSTDVDPLNIWTGIVTNKTVNGFRVQLNGIPDSSNYYLHWAIMEGIAGEPPVSPGATTYLLSGPSSGDAGVASTNFTVALPGGTTVPAPVTITPSDGGGGGTFTPTSVVITTGAPSATFTYTPVSAGTKTIAVTNSGTLTNPASLSYVASAPSSVHLLNTLISYWKMDESGGTRNDSQGTNHLAEIVATTNAFAAKINNGAYFAGANDIGCASNASLQITGDTTFSFWMRQDPQTSTPTFIISKFYSGGAADTDYQIGIATADGFLFEVLDSSSGSTKAVTGTYPSDYSWVHVIAWYDSTTKKAYLRINDTTTYTAPTAITAPNLTTTAFRVGGRAYDPAPLGCNGILDEVGFWKRKLTAAEITALYNGGAGLPFSSFTT